MESDITDDVIVDITPITPQELYEETDIKLVKLYASHPDTPANALRVLENYPKIDVVRAVAANPNTPEDVLDRLTVNGHEYWTSLAMNPSTPKASLVQILAASDRGNAARCFALGNPHTPLVSIMELLLTSLNVSERTALNTNTRFRELLRFAEDSDGGMSDERG